MSEEREEVYQILELGKHLKNLHHKKGFGGLLFIDLSMIKFSKLSSYIRQLDKENEELKEQLHDASIQIQELIEQDMWCPSNCSKLKEILNQQKEFIEYLTSYIDLLSNEPDLIEENQKDILEEILSKYRSIIGDYK